MIALCRKASCVVLVEASRVLGKGEEEGRRRGRPTETKLLAGWRKRLSPQLSAVCIKGATVDRRCGVWTDVWTSRRISPGRLALCLLWSSSAWSVSMGRDHPFAPSAYSKYCPMVRAATEQMSSRDIRHSARMRQPPPTAAIMRARRMIKAMTGTELPRPSRSGAGAAVTKRGGAVSGRWGRSHPAYQMPWRTVKPNIYFECWANISQMDIASAPIRGEPNVLKVGERFAMKNRLDVPWFQFPSCCSASKVVVDLCMEGTLNL